MKKLIDLVYCAKYIKIITSILFFSFLSTIVIPSKVFSQSQIFSAQDSITFDELVHRVEAKFSVVFFYDRSEITKSKFHWRNDYEDIHSILDATLAKAGYFYSIDSKNRVFVTLRFPIVTYFGKDSLGLNIDSIDSKSFFEGSSGAKVLSNQIIQIGQPSINADQELFLNGVLRLNTTGALLEGVKVHIEGTNLYTTTDAKGRYAIKPPSNKFVLVFSKENLAVAYRNVVMYSSGSLDVNLIDKELILDEVQVFSVKNSDNLQLGIERLDVGFMKKMPVVFGEADVVKSIISLPGVQTVGEAASGYNVRGGATDQNLILFNGATIFNPSHLFGLFSAFNPDAIREVALYKSSIPVKYGGRISSVLDISGKYGDKDKISGTGGVGLLTTKLTLEGPIGKKTTFLVGGRTTYSDWLMGLIEDPTLKNTSVSFYDVNIGVRNQINENSTVGLTGYLSNDNFTLNDSLSNGYSNKNVNLEWINQFSQTLSGNFTVGFDSYSFNYRDHYIDSSAYRYDYFINQYFVKLGFLHRLNDRHELSFGVNTVGYRLSLGSKKPFNSLSGVATKIMPTEQALESTIYFSDEFKWNDRLRFNLGLRYTFFSELEKQHQEQEVNISNGGKKAFYNGPEFRFSSSYSMDDNGIIKFGFNSLYQYLHMLSNTTSISPTDTWKLSDVNIKPQKGQQFSFGYSRSFLNSILEFEGEVYYKNIKNYLDYKTGVTLLMNENIANDVVNTKGRAYGLELSLKKMSGKVNGWISYAYSKVEQKTIVNSPIDQINNGNYYPANYDKPHNVNFVGNYAFSKRFSLSLITDYSTGRPITLPIGIYEYAGSERILYSNRNQYRIPDYFRVDVSINIEGSHKLKKLAYSSWSFGVYNATGRKNPYSVYFVSEGQKIKGYKFSVFGQQIPFVTYNFKF